MGVDARDVNNDGLPDIALVALDHEDVPHLPQRRPRQLHRGYRRERAWRARATRCPDTARTVADFDNDGWKDLFVSRGDVQSSALAAHKDIAQPNTVFANLEGKSWQAIHGDQAGYGAQLKRHRGSADGDFNHDGKLDLVVSAIGAPAEIWMNDTPNHNHWLELALEGTKSNRDGIGAKIKVVAGGFNSTTTSASRAATPRRAPVRHTSASAEPRS